MPAYNTLCIRIVVNTHTNTQIYTQKKKKKNQTTSLVFKSRNKIVLRANTHNCESSSCHGDAQPVSPAVAGVRSEIMFIVVLFEWIGIYLVTNFFFFSVGLISRKQNHKKNILPESFWPSSESLIISQKCYMNTDIQISTKSTRLNKKTHSSLSLSVKHKSLIATLSWTSVLSADW